MKPASYSVGEQVAVGGRLGRFVRILDFDRYLVRFENGDTRVVGSEELDGAPVIGAAKRHFDDCSPAEIEEAYRWRDALQPLLDGAVDRGERDAFIANAAEKLGVSRATIYRRLDQWNGDPVSLLPGKRPGGRGKSRLGDAREALLAHVLDKEYFNRKQRNVKEVYNDFVLPAFADAGLSPPGMVTVYRYVANVDPILAIEKRMGKRAARDAKATLMGKFPFGTAPLSCVQIDYWPYDVEVVDDVYRLPIGRPWLAMIICTHTCMPTGYVLTLDPPSASVAGAAVFHSITRKEAWLREIGFEMIWPVWGTPQILMADNAKEFRGTMLRRFLSQEDRELINRPVKRPQFGAHIERFFGTLARKVKAVPGATGANLRERKTRDSAKSAGLTLHDLEIHLLSLLKEYMNTPHSSLGGLTPLQKWRSCFFEDGAQVRELPEEPNNLEQIGVRGIWCWKVDDPRTLGKPCAYRERQADRDRRLRRKWRLGGFASDPNPDAAGGRRSQALQQHPFGLWSEGLAVDGPGAEGAHGSQPDRTVRRQGPRDGRISQRAVRQIRQTLALQRPHQEPDERNRGAHRRGRDRERRPGLPEGGSAQSPLQSDQA